MTTAPTLDSLFGRGEGIDADRDERARRAVKAFRALQPTLTAYARVLTKNNRVRVEMAARDSSTDGHRIFYRPPIGLGDPAKHNRGQCDRRDADNQLICPACCIRERVLVVIYHEIAHIAFGTFTQPSPEDILDVIQQAVRSVGGWYGEVVRKRIEVAPGYKTKDFINLASLISEFLPIVYNALDDARVNRELFKARQGVKVMFDADTWRIFADGVEQKDSLGNVVVKKWNKYPLNMQVIVGVFCKAAGYDYSSWFAPQVIEALADDDLTALIGKLDTIRTTKGVYYLSFPILARLVELDYCVEERDEPPLSEPPPLPEPPSPEPPPEAEEPKDADEEPGNDGSPDKSDDDGGDSDAGPDSGLGSGSDPDDQKESDTDDTEASPEASDDTSDSSSEGETGPPEEDASEAGDGDSPGPGGDSGESETPDESDEPGGGSGADSPDGQPSGDPGGDGDDDDASDSGGSDEDGSESDEPGAGESDGGGTDPSLPGQTDSDNPPSGDTESVDSNHVEQDKSGITGPGEVVSTDEERTDAESPEGDSGQPDGRDDDSDGSSEQSEAGDAGDESDGGSEEDEEATGDSSPSDSGGLPGDTSGDHGDPAAEGGRPRLDLPGGSEDSGTDDPDVPEPEAETEVPTPEASDDDPPPVTRDDAEQDAEPIDQGADDGTGGIEVEENAKNDDIPMGTAEEARIGLVKWGGHEDKPKTVAENEAQEQDNRAVDRAVVQGIYFETSSRNIYGVREHHFGAPIFAPTLGPNGERYCMSRGWELGRNTSYARTLLGIDADTTTEESILGSALLKMRVAFADNQRGSDTRHRKSGKVDGRVLGRRAALGDERIFRKRELPGKRNYFVLIGIDISGSTAGVNLVLAKKAAFAQANLLTRMGIPFAIYCHSGNFHDPALGRTAGLDLDIYVIKEPGDVWDKHTQKRLQEIGPDSANLDGHSFEYYRKVLDSIQATDKILLYYTDGKMPAENHDEELEILQRELKICKLKGYHILGVGIRTDSPKRHGLNTVCVEEDKDIVLVIDQLRKELLAASARRG